MTRGAPGPGDALGLLAGGAVISGVTLWLLQSGEPDAAAAGLRATALTMLGLSAVLAVVVVAFRHRIFPASARRPPRLELGRFGRILGVLAGLAAVAVALLIFLPALLVLWGLGTIWK